jgi:[citrate (pro-3S)-lyase] ligase
LQISRRFAGEEPLDPVTAAYNEAMRASLPDHGVEVRIIPRKCLDGQPISASRVRRLIAEGKLAETRALLPATTYAYLTSDAARPVLEKIRASAAATAAAAAGITAGSTAGDAT